MDFSKICRICLDSNKQTFDLFTSFYAKRNTFYSDMLTECTKLKPHEKDGLPRQICKECTRQLKRSYAFNIQCENSEKELKNHMLTKQVGESKSLPDNCDETNDRKMKNEEIKHEVKYELNSDIENNTHNSNVTRDNEKNNDIKSEPNFNDADDSCWDAEDNILLKEIRPNVDTSEQELDNEKEKPKKKRGRKKKDADSISDARKPHQCDICGKFLSTKSNLKAHKICHTDMRPYKCTECPATFRGHSALFQHKKVHSGDTPYHCEFCSKRFSRRTGLVNHVRIHTGEKQYSCDICFKSFIQSAQLSIHMKRHNGDKPFLCQDCGKGFPIKADLMVHQRIHNGEKPYSCTLCTKTFATSGNLSIHRRIHNKEIRYNCKECNRGFVTCSAYSVHLKRHKGQRDYSCECGKTFYTSSALKQHKIVHTGEKKYQCKICDRKFSQCSHLSRHFKRDHLKANAPVPSSDHYKLVLDNGRSKLWTVVDDAIQKVPLHHNHNVNIEEKLTQTHILNETDKCNES
ncbi:zinc finger protein 239-like [Galleria mellonella]|uniref:Zinc finger protein 239-like n=1 Tax=Galleria mellonella TaxID=7137 RepID=A0A6J1X2L3_GALME|nr:zinc finger protein 239-like [Galleria mellonella]